MMALVGSCGHDLSRTSIVRLCFCLLGGGTIIICGVSIRIGNDNLDLLLYAAIS